MHELSSDVCTLQINVTSIKPFFSTVAVFLLWMAHLQSPHIVNADWFIYSQLKRVNLFRHKTIYLSQKVKNNNEYSTHNLALNQMWKSLSCSVDFGSQQRIPFGFRHFHSHMHTYTDRDTKYLRNRDMKRRCILFRFVVTTKPTGAICLRNRLKKAIFTMRLIPNYIAHTNNNTTFIAAIYLMLDYHTVMYAFISLFALHQLNFRFILSIQIQKLRFV